MEHCQEVLSAFALSVVPNCVTKQRFSWCWCWCGCWSRSQLLNHTLFSSKDSIYCRWQMSNDCFIRVHQNSCECCLLIITKGCQKFVDLCNCKIFQLLNHVIIWVSLAHLEQIHAMWII